MAGRAATAATLKEDHDDLAKLQFLVHMHDGGMIMESVYAAGICKATAYRWYNSDPEFAQAWDDAIESGTEVLEIEATRRAVDGIEEPVIYQGQLTPIYEHNRDGTLRMVQTTERNDKGEEVKVQRPVQARDAQGNPRYLTVRKPSDTLMIFLLKARRPEKYRDRSQFEHVGKGGKELPAPVSNTTVQAGVLVVPGVIDDPAAWTALVQRAPQPKDAADE